MLFDQSIAHPEIVRLTLWDRLERGGQGARQPAVQEANRAKVAAIRQAQDDRRLSNRIPAAHLLLLVTTTAGIWAFARRGPDGTGSEGTDEARATLVDAVRILTGTP